MILTNTDAELVRVREQLFVSHAFHVGVGLSYEENSQVPTRWEQMLRFP